MKKNIIIMSLLLLACSACILYITLYSRGQTLTRIIYTDLFWTYREWFAGAANKGVSIAWNIALFVPFGYFAAALISPDGKSKTVLLAAAVGFVFSLLIEFIQYRTGRGTADTDDLFNNVLGTLLGAVLYLTIYKSKPLCIVVPFFLIGAGLFGCFRIAKMVANPVDHIHQFWFSIDTVSADSFSGRCYTYDGSAPSYQIFLKEGRRFYPACTTVDGDVYKADFDLSGNDDLEVFVDFDGVGKITTDTYFRDGQVRYVSPYPETEHDDEKLLPGAVLKAYSKEYDTFVYVRPTEDGGGELIWLIGYDIAPTTEIIYHIYTNEPALLPENQIQYGFDNRGFRTQSGATGNGEEVMLGHYRLFVRPLPTEYNVTSITVGFNPGSGVVWRDGFRP